MTLHAKPSLPRDANETHRAATPLELLFDLVSVIAIALAVAGLHHAISGNHAIDGLISFVIAFFAIWWAWMNYTWYASAYDNDDTVFRLLSMMAMGGSLVIAAGIDPLFKSSDISLLIAGYVIMRAAMIILWIRAAKHDPARRKTAFTYAIGIAIAQVYWVGVLLFQPESLNVFYTLFAIGVVIELAVPGIAERQAATPWHKEHITERYGLLFIIVMGELLLGGALALKAANVAALDPSLISVALCSLLITFSMWWVYFAREDHLQSQKLSAALLWGYGHIFVFASAAAVGGGLAVCVDVLTDHAKVGLPAAVKAVAIPLSIYFFSLWFIRDRLVLSGLAQYTLPVFAVLILSAAFVQLPLEVIAVFAILCVLMRNGLARASSKIDLG